MGGSARIMVPAAPQRAEIGPRIFGLGLMPSQVESVHQTSPEKRLLLAVLEDGIGRLQRFSGTTAGPAATGMDARHRRYWRDAIAWFEDPTEELLLPYVDPVDGARKLGFGFRGLCEQLGFDASAVLRGMRAKGWLPAQEDGGAGETARMAEPRGEAGNGERLYRRTIAGRGRSRLAMEGP